MAILKLASANATLLDAHAGAALRYEGNLSVLPGGTVYELEMAPGISLDQTNLINTFDSNAATTGILPRVRLRLEGTQLPAIAGQSFSLGWNLTAGDDAERVTGEKQISFVGLTVSASAVKDGVIYLNAGNQSIKVTAYRSSSDAPLSATVNFSPTDSLGRIYMDQGQPVLELDFMMMLPKLEVFKSTLDLFNKLYGTSYTPASLLSPGDYYLTLTGLPLATSTGPVMTLALDLSLTEHGNHAPTVRGMVQATAEDTPLALGLAAFGFSDVDSADSLQCLQVSRLPQAGGLTLAGEAVFVGQQIEAAKLVAGQLVFTPALDASGSSYADLGFRVSDGRAWSDGMGTLSLDVTPVDDIIQAKFRMPGGSAIDDVYFDGHVYTKAVTAQDLNAITVFDALLCLRAVKGLIQLDDAQRLAADVDGDGVLDLDDVRAILQLAVGSEARDLWLFESGAASTAQNEVHLIGILKGDVDGSWA